MSQKTKNEEFKKIIFNYREKWDENCVNYKDKDNEIKIKLNNELEQFTQKYLLESEKGPEILLKLKQNDCLYYSSINMCCFLPICCCLTSFCCCCCFNSKIIDYLTEPRFERTYFNALRAVSMLER